jgi:hypothetical protein
MGFIKKAAVATALATAVVAMVGQGGAFADGDIGPFSDAGVAIGTGTITPGLTTTSCTQNVTFTGTVVTDGDEGVNTGGVSFGGASVGCETLNNGQGTGNLSGALAGAVDYTRIGNLVTLSGTINGDPVLAGACLFVPTSVNPVTSYALACAAAE